MGFWNSAETLRQVSLVLMWSTVVFAVLAAGSTGLRFYVDRRVGELSSRSQKAQDEESQRRIAASEAEVAALKVKNEPRTLPPASRTALLAFLQGKPAANVIIKASINATDARALADQIAAVLKSAGWTVRVDSAMFTGPDTTGLWMVVKDSASAPAGAGLLQAALKSVGLDARGQIDPSLDPLPGDFWLCVGNR